MTVTTITRESIRPCSAIAAKYTKTPSTDIGTIPAINGRLKKMNKKLYRTKGIYVTRYTVPDPSDPFCSYIKRVTVNRGMCNHEDVEKLEALACEMLEIIQALEHCSRYWSDFKAPVGIVDKMRAVIAKAKGVANEQ